MKQFNVAPLIYMLLLCASCAMILAQNQPPAPPHAILLENTALAPVRAVAEGMGAAISLDTATLAVTLTRNDIMVMLTPYNTTATSNGKAVSLPVSPLLREGQLFIPLRAMATTFGAAIELRGGTVSDSAKSIALVYQGKTTLFRAVEAGRMLKANLTGGSQTETAFAVANVIGIDAYNSPYLTDIVPLEVWVVHGTRALWRLSLDKGVSISQFQAPELTGDRTPELLLTFLTRHSYMGPYPGSIYHTSVFRWNGQTFPGILSLDYSHDHGKLFIEHVNPATAASFILVDTNWRVNEDITHYVAERYTWNGSRFRLAKRVVTRTNITTLSAARRILR